MKTHRSRLLIGVLLVALSSSCASTGKPGGSGQSGSGEPVFPWNPSYEPVQGELLSHDGGVVDSPGPGSIVKGSGPSHDIAPTGEGRMMIVELYQEALDKLEEAEAENDALLATVERLERDLLEARGFLEERVGQLSAVELENQRLLEENIELASRLTTAQLHRLEAERILLEAKIAWLQPLTEAEPRTEGAVPDSAPPNTPPATASAWDLDLEDDQ